MLNNCVGNHNKLIFHSPVFQLAVSSKVAESPVAAGTCVDRVTIIIMPLAEMQIVLATIPVT